MSPMSDQPVTLAVLTTALARFHRDVIRPDTERVFEALFERLIKPRFDEIDGRFDAIYHKLEKLETDYEFFKVGLARVEERLQVLEHQYQDLLAGLHRLEDRLSRVEAQVDQVVADRAKEALRTEVADLRSRVDVLQLRVRNLEKRVDREPEP
jgi:predicted  nucleic acid-binding Zn-ribbon protein